MSGPSVSIDGARLSGREREVYVASMFDRIARPYDRLNTLISLGRDRSWRALGVKMAGIGPGARVADLGCGTGEFLLALKHAAGPTGEVVGVDIADRMLDVAREKVRRAGFAGVRLVHGNAADTGLPVDFADAVTMGWVLRNVGDRPATYREVLRVLKPGGRFVSLDCARIASPIVRLGHRIYLHGVMPLLVRMSGGDRESYRYLANSTDRFLTPAELDGELLGAGFRDVKHRLLMCGSIAIHVGTKP